MQMTTAYDACPLCGNRGASALGTVDVRGHRLWSSELPPVLTWLRCVTCGHMHTSHYYTPEGLTALFARVQDGQSVGTDAEIGRLHASRAIARVASFVPAGRWLDVGVGNGALVMTAAEFGYQAQGIDPRAANVAMLQRLGLDGTASRWEDYAAPHLFDVISMADVIEHMPFPVEALRRAADTLRPGGALFISTPNIDAPLWSLMSVAKQNPYWTEIEHHHVFGRVSLSVLLERVGLTVVNYAVSERFVCGMELIARKKPA